MRLLVGALATMGVILCTAGSAEAYSTHDFRIRDEGPEIVARVVICTYPPPGYELKYDLRVHVETEDGRDRRNVNFDGWVDRGCTELTTRFRDTLHFEGYTSDAFAYGKEPAARCVGPPGGSSTAPSAS